MQNAEENLQNAGFGVQKAILRMQKADLGGQVVNEKAPGWVWIGL